MSDYRFGLVDKVLRFNPYRVGHEELVACTGRGRWQPFPALTQMVIFHFLDIRPVRTHHDFDAIFYRIGDSFRLKGSVTEQADMIRQQMCRSKVAMLQDVMSYPTSLCYPGNGSASVDYATSIRTALQTIDQYSKPI